MEAPKTVSTSTRETARGTHVFNIAGYSKQRGIGVGKFVSSGVFSVGGYDWTIIFFPDGIGPHTPRDCVSIAVLRFGLDVNAKVRASCQLRLVNQSTGAFAVPKRAMRMFEPAPGKWRFLSTIKERLVEEFVCVRNDLLVVECTVTVTRAPGVPETKLFPKIEVPPSDFTAHFGKLLEEKDGVDVTFSVGGETFAAHKVVLAARSPVFRAEFYGPMREARAQCVTIDEMQPDVFRALLHFIYTDSLPEMDDCVAGDGSEMIRHLLVAADRYAMDRLKLICQSIICDNLNVETVADALALADQHNCDKLKDACFEFIASSNAMDVVVATQGYKNLKRTCPSVLVDAFERTTRLRKT